MKLEIELDLNRIDYDAINKQIAEKISELDITKAYDIDAKIKRKISDHVEDKVKNAYSKYIERLWTSIDETTSEGRNLIEQVTKEKIEDYTKETMEKIFASEYDEETMKEIMINMIPDVFTAILFSQVDKALYRTQNEYWLTTQNMVNTKIAEAIYRMRR